MLQKVKNKIIFKADFHWSVSKSCPTPFYFTWNDQVSDSYFNWKYCIAQNWSFGKSQSSPGILVEICCSTKILYNFLLFYFYKRFYAIRAHIFGVCKLSSSLHLLRERTTYLLLSVMESAAHPLLATEIWSRWYHEMYWLVRKSYRTVQITLLKRGLS